MKSAQPLREQVIFSVRRVAPGAIGIAEMSSPLRPPKLGCPFLGEKLIVSIGAENFDLISVSKPMASRIFRRRTPAASTGGRAFSRDSESKRRGGVSCRTFAPTAFGNGLTLQIARETIQLRVQNVSSEPADFNASLFGKGTTIRGALQEAARRQRALDALGNKKLREP